MLKLTTLNNFPYNSGNYGGVAFESKNVLKNRQHYHKKTCAALNQILKKICFFLIFSNIIGVSFQNCVWYGVCNEDLFEHKQYCFYNESAKPLSQEGILLLKERCSHLLEDQTMKFCCDEEQVYILNTNIKLAANFLDRCPSCMGNLVRHMCDFTCSSNQSDFLKVVSTSQSASGKLYVNSLELHITAEYTNNTYKSCSQVSVPSTGQLALDLMCGNHMASRCSPTKWFQYMGDVNNVYVPFQITYVQHENSSTLIDGYNPLNPKTIPCNATLNEWTPSCSCSDCENSCPLPLPDPPIPVPIKIGDFDAYTIIMTVVFFVGTMLFLMGVCLFPSKIEGEGAEAVDLQSDGDEEISEFQFGYFEQMGATTEKFLESFFASWGKYFALRPWTTLTGGVCAVIILSCGINFLHITTDPVNLWASPQSRSRIEREFFDSTFQPFYRIEQIIIKAVNLPEILHNTSNGLIIFGPVFDKEFLIDVLNLQEGIKSLQGHNGSMLKDICFSPLTFGNIGDTQSSNCVVQSIWGYFQDDLERLDNTDEDNGFNTTRNNGYVP